MHGTGKLLPVHYSSIPPFRSFIHPFYTIVPTTLFLEHSCIRLLTNLYHTCLYYQNHVMVAGWANGFEYPMADYFHEVLILVSPPNAIINSTISKEQ